MSDGQFPHYDPPGPPILERKDAAPMIKMISKMARPKMRTRTMGRTKGLQSDQNVHVKHGKKKVVYW
jgi:hypothetical protein